MKKIFLVLGVLTAMALMQTANARLINTGGECYLSWGGKTMIVYNPQCLVLSN
jgi:hypothetical protein